MNSDVGTLKFVLLILWSLGFLTMLQSNAVVNND